ncbi:GntR family transcriptional repressor for pyruvate dehydrogenase complex [Roseibium hamelinense]|uniref:Pyruvate dehydrogenase complex repressor n=1 Tax=Roseibium hamelinense TaxID=150831 RepID=A0A562T2C7_9HYPH|nr:FadR/GntR family transcriptional regulator [Roseibium hamelinense]MTI43344.1 FadR family transcriptional regulator [Roseibium hamelinense]TWI87543.1 GntR family transcriptional repressor for pyruvate dehydrogenase complex [Roseibium hamelinense]
MFQKIEHHRTAEAVVAQIEKLILKGVLASGDRLPPERDLSADLDVSRPVLREALKILEDRQLVVSRQGGGTFIADVVGPLFSDPLTALIERHPVAIADYMEYRRDVEGLAAYYAAERATNADIKIIDNLTSAMQVAFDDLNHEREAFLDVEFHQAIGEAAHNTILLHSLRACYKLLKNGVFYNREQLYNHPTARREVLRQHNEIAAKIKAGEPQAARNAAENHINYVKAAIEDTKRMSERQALSELRLKSREPTAEAISASSAKGHSE